MLITVVLMLFKDEDKKELRGAVKSQWSALRGFNCQHSNSYIIPQPTDLFCHRIVLAKLNILTSFSLHFLPNIEGAYTPHMIFQWRKGIVSPPQKTWRDLFINTFHSGWGTNLGGSSTCGINDQIMPRVREFHSCIFK